MSFLSLEALSSMVFHTLGLEVSVFAVYANGSNSWLKPSTTGPGHLQTGTLKQSVCSSGSWWLY